MWSRGGTGTWQVTAAEASGMRMLWPEERAEGKGLQGERGREVAWQGLEGLGETRALWDPGPRPECSRRVFPAEFPTLLDFILGCGEPCEVREQGRGGF